MLSKLKQSTEAIGLHRRLGACEPLVPQALVINASLPILCLSTPMSGGMRAAVFHECLLTVAQRVGSRVFVGAQAIPKLRSGQAKLPGRLGDIAVRGSQRLANGHRFYFGQRQTREHRV